MKIDKHINALLDRFMAGETSIGEEAQLAEYFRTHAVEEELRPYQEMFAYFDRGMQETAPVRRIKRRYWALAAAAIVALLVMIVWPKPQPVRPLAQQATPAAVVSADTGSRSASDSIIHSSPRTNSTSPVYHKSRHITRPPRRLMAANSCRIDSVDHATEQLVNERVRRIEAEQAYVLRWISAIASTRDQGLELIMASMETEENDNMY